MKGTLTLATVALSLLIASTVNSKILVREFAGNKPTTTAEFTVDGPWLLD